MATKAFAIIAGVGPGTVCCISNHHLDIHTNNQQGASIARRFAKAYPVVLLARNQANYDPLVKEINTSGGQAVGISTDLSDSSSVRSAFEKIAQQFSSSPLAAAVFNPGGGFVCKPFLELTDEEFEVGYESQGCVSLLWRNGRDWLTECLQERRIQLR